MEFRICMGCLADPIKKQVKEQGLVISNEKAKELQKYMDAILLLYIGGIMNETEKHSMQKKLYTQIKKSVRFPKEK